MDPIKSFKDCMSCLATGVNVISTKVGNNFSAVTINTFTSLSLDPMLVLFNLKKDSFCYQDFITAKNFSVNILSEKQQDLSQLFTTEIDNDSWKNIHSLKKEMLCLEDSIAYLESEVHQVHEGGDHSIIIGKIINTEILNKDSSPLLYYDRKYHKLKK